MARPRFKFTPLQIFTHVAAWIPGLVLAWDAAQGNLSVNPYQAATQRAGNIALVLLILSLACTPVNTIFRVPQVIKLRRPLGLYAFLYATLHVYIFTGLDYGFNWRLLYNDLSDKRYILVGLAAFLILLALAATSWDWWKVRLKKTWKRLHRLVYLAGGLVVLHFAWVVKGDVTSLQGDIFRPLLAGIVVTLLLVARIPIVRKRISGVGQNLLPSRARPPARPAPRETTQ
jgi:methionine sulfoxide reductase heme-binding subunit